MRLEIDTGSLAVLGTQRTVAALVDMEANLEQGKARKETQHGAHRTDCITIGAPVAPCQYADDDAGRCRHQQRRERLHPDTDGIESIAVHLLGKVSQQVVA